MNPLLLELAGLMYFVAGFGALLSIADVSPSLKWVICFVVICFFILGNIDGYKINRW